MKQNLNFAVIRNEERLGRVNNGQWRHKGREWPIEEENKDSEGETGEEIFMCRNDEIILLTIIIWRVRVSYK